jgi:trk system potassium uptake protein TrkH
MLRNINFFNVLNVLGLGLIFESLFILTTIPVAAIYHDPHIPGLLESFLIIIFLGLTLFFITKKKCNTIKRRESLYIALLIWIVIPILGALPYLLTGEIKDVFDAVFESVSGFTTTGSSILVDIEAMSPSILFWRALTHWIGGLGILMLVVALIPFIQSSGNNLVFSEGNLLETEKIRPRMIEVAKTLWLIYIGLTLTETIILKLEGMSFFDAVCHSFATIATGGFSTKNTSIAEMSPTIQYTICLFMILSGMSFVLHYKLATGKFKSVFSNVELKFFLGIILVSSVIIFFSNIRQEENLSSDIRDSIFQATSMVTTTGFASANYERWTPDAKFILILLMLSGGCVGSTSGGIKIRRLIIVKMMLKRQIINLIHPKAITRVRFDNVVVTGKIFQRVSAFIAIYFLTILFGTVILNFSGLDFRTSISAVITTLGGVGPGFGGVGPMDNFYSLPDFAKVYLSMNMVLGRLEILPVIALFHSISRYS